MNAPSSSPEAVPQIRSTTPELTVFSTVEIDRSCCLAVTFFFAGAVKWLMIGLIFGLISSIKLHSAGFLGGLSWLTYGRIYPASLNALAYGFASQVAFGLTLWLLARLGRVALVQSKTILLGGFFWNVGVVMGVIGILVGHNTGYQWLEMPGYASPLLFAGYILIGVGAVSTFHLRRQRQLYVSQWFLLAALLWFPWIYSTAQLLLVFGSVRGTLQTVVNGWFAHNFFVLWLSSAGLAAVFYFIPKILNRPLHSRYLALFAFWMLALFGSWGGLHAAEAIPKWISSISIVATVMTLIPVIAIAMNWHLTITRDCSRVLTHPVLRFIIMGAACYLIGSGLEILGALRSVSRVALFTHYESGVTMLRLLGFIGMVGAGSIYYIMPRVTQYEWPAPKLIEVHFWLAAAGVALVIFGLVGAGILQGLKLQDPAVPFINTVRATIPFLGFTTLGELLLIGANGALLFNLARLLRACACSCCCVTVEGCVTPVKSAPAGARR
jgi:cytochrome c oxidase cbb3-type subunit I